MTSPTAVNPQDRPQDRIVTPGQWVGFLSMVLGMFMAILDIQIVASSIGQIQAGLSASAQEVSWVQSAYLIAEVVMIPISGYLARILSTRILFVASCATFTLASMACAFAWNIESMMVFRAVQGFLGGAMIPTVFATIYILFPPRFNAMLSVVVGLVATMAPTLGPTLGGWLTETFRWHWLFLINVGPGLVVTVLVALFVTHDRPQRHLLQTMDWAGAALIALFLGSLQYVLEEGPADDWFESRTIVVLSVVSALSGAAFFARSLTASHPIVDLTAFRDRNFAVGCLYSFIVGVGLYGSVFILPLFLGRIQGYSALEIGVTMMVTGLFQFLSAPLAGALATRMDLRAMLFMGLALFGGGLWLNADLTSQWGYWDLFVPQLVRGLSLMFCFVPINAVALGHLPPDRVQNASGLYNLMRNLGGAIGLAFLTTLLTRRIDTHMADLAAGINAANGAVTDRLQSLSAGLTHMVGANADQAALSLVYAATRQQAMTLAFADLFRAMALVFVAGLVLMPLVRKVDHPSTDGGH